MESIIRVPLPWISARLGRPCYLIAQPPPAVAFFDGMPDVFPGTECYSKFSTPEQRANILAVEVWVDRVLRACELEPRIDLRRLGPDRTNVVLFLFRQWGWIKRQDGTTVGLPGKNFCGVLRRMAKEVRVLPSELMKRPINEFIFDYHVLFEDADARAARRRRHGLPPAPEVKAGFAMNDDDPSVPDEVEIDLEALNA